MRVFITGGAGFIGSWIVEKLVEKGYMVTVYDNFSTGLPENLSNVISKISIIKGDILDYEKLKTSMANHDIVNHQAAQLEIMTAIGEPQKDVRTNIIGSLNILKASKELGIKKLIFASSACVYGNLNKYLVKEEDIPQPNWEYGVSKLAVEKYCDIYAMYEGLNIASLRYSIVYGEREWYGRVLTIFLKRALEGKKLVIFGEGNNIRDFIHVEDVADVNLLLTEKEWHGHLILNVSTGIAISIKELATLVQKIIKELEERDVNIIYEQLREGEYSQYVKGRLRIPRELLIMSLDSYKLKTMFNWFPKVDLYSGIKREYMWLKGNVNRWKKMSY